jgi:hypothetical protein
MRYRLVRTISVAGFVADASPGVDTVPAIVLDDWLSDQASNTPTRGCRFLIRYFNEAGDELEGGSATVQAWAKTNDGSWASEAAAVCAEGRVIGADLYGELYFKVTALTVDAVPTAVTMELWVAERGELDGATVDWVNANMDRLDNIPTDTTTALALKEDKANKGAASGYMPLVGGLAPVANLPPASAISAGTLASADYELMKLGAKATIAVTMNAFGTWADGQTIVTPVVGSKTLKVTAAGDIDIVGLTESAAKAFIAAYLTNAVGSVVNVSPTGSTMTVTAKAYGTALNTTVISGTVLAAPGTMASGLAPQVANPPPYAAAIAALGTMSTQAANAVAITGGTVAGLTSLGASTVVTGAGALVAGTGASFHHTIWGGTKSGVACNVLAFDGGSRFGVLLTNGSGDRWALGHAPGNLALGSEVLYWNPSGYVGVNGRFLGAQGADIASANDITLGNGNYFDITGTTEIRRILGTGWTAGSRVVLQFDSTPTVKHGIAAGSSYYGFQLAGGIDFTADAGDTLSLVFDGAWWRQA